jgi:hypothetical protein
MNLSYVAGLKRSDDDVRHAMMRVVESREVR